jgi:hypothetical protein
MLRAVIEGVERCRERAVAGREGGYSLETWTGKLEPSAGREQAHNPGGSRGSVRRALESVAGVF